ncbi:hypothetical protein BU24DRAFT_412265 [Aaosphaeria arxii CBS 175.79]|uniref:C2H2-type domain-containing protein n=1 Tax=Aaosphaeria arxii CBS 175.79 TaxID=1450172 RepID=A0A6A5XJA9_9PLEO|nr:uncharacterized protein BU24DRAFT_412265 [Aaosphaeria arxii CBS 175.79]KAF2012956.1 hypothetical protein BU24DRAFT_412265 [Aaosphaeria arxii CBS 175.79]
MARGFDSPAIEPAVWPIPQMDPLVGIDWNQVFRRLPREELWRARLAWDDVWSLTSFSDPLHSASAPPLSHQAQDTSIRGTSAYSGETALPDLIRSQYSRSVSVVDSKSGSNGPASHTFSPPAHPHAFPSSANTPQAAPESAARSGRRNSAIFRNVCQKYFCPHSYLHEGKTIRFINKHDWKRHDKDFHETGEEYTCPVSDCTSVFSRPHDLKAHCSRTHRIKDPAIMSPRVLPAKLYYACGFEDCTKRTTNWKDWCDHVARCMKEGGKEWSYNHQMLNLLGQPDVAPAWLEVVSIGYSNYDVSPHQLTWDPETTRGHKEMLECQTYGNDLKGFLQRLWWLGKVSNTAPRGFPSTVTANAFDIPLAPRALGAQDDMNGNDNGNEQFNLAPATRPRGFSSQTPSEHEFFQSFSDGSVNNNLDITNNRTSVAMPDAPPLVTADDLIEYGRFPMPDDAGMTAQDVLLGEPHFPTPPLPYLDESMSSSSPTGQSESSPKRRSLVRLSKGLFNHHFRSEQLPASPMPEPSQLAPPASMAYGSSPRRSNYEVWSYAAHHF